MIQVICKRGIGLLDRSVLFFPERICESHLIGTTTTNLEDCKLLGSLLPPDIFPTAGLLQKELYIFLAPGRHA